MELHLKEMKELTDNLSSVGALISHEDQVVTLLGSLQFSFSTLVMALEARIDDISIDYVQQTLLQEEKKRDVSAGEPSTPMSNNTAQYGGCKRAKHPRPPPVCWKCNEMGHVQHFCPNKERKSQTADHKAKVTKSQSEDEGAFTAANNMPPMNGCIIDSGASSHMTSQKEYLSQYRQFETPENVGLGDGRVVDAVGTGTLHLTMLFKTSDPKDKVLCNVLYLPKLACNQFSVRAAAHKGNSIKFQQSRCWIHSRHGELCGPGSLVGKLYQLNFRPSTKITEHASPAAEHGSINLRHQ